LNDDASEPAMDSLFSRYRNLTVLLLVLLVQLILLAYQVRSNQDVRLIRVWAVTAVTPLARVLETVRSNTVRFVESYLLLVDVKEENRRLDAELGRLKMENRFLRAELETADRAQAMVAFQSRIPSRTIGARIIGTGAGASSKVVFLDRGSAAGAQRGMAVITPEGVVGKVISVFPTASQALLITDPSFAAGVISRKNRVQGTLKGTGQAACLVDHLENDEPVEVGEWFYTSGDDRVFPRGLPVGRVKRARRGKTFQEVIVAPSGMENGLEEVLIVLEGVHQPIPAVQRQEPGINLLPPPPTEPSAASGTATEAQDVTLGTDADRLREHYRRVGKAQSHVYGEGLPGSRPPDFNLKPSERNRETPAGPVRQPTPASKPKTTEPNRPPADAGQPLTAPPGSPPVAKPKPPQPATNDQPAIP
jgi:rod shape-determining protein MreC